MKGLGKRVTVAFLGVVTLLAVAGVISLFELSNFSYNTSEVLSVSDRDTKVVKEMRSAAYNHGRAMVDIALFGEYATGKEACAKVSKQIDSCIVSARTGASVAVSASLDSLAEYAAILQQLAANYNTAEKRVVEVKPEPEPVHVEGDTIVIDLFDAETPKAKVVEKVVNKPSDVKAWFKEVYEPAYNNFVKQVERYSTISRGELLPHAERLSKNAYRSVMPVLISLAVMIAIVLMLYYFIYIYAVKPVVRINRALSDYLSFKMPYKVKATMIDEVKNLSDNIEHLINASKSNIKQ